jgi:general stress protein 26
MTDDPAKHVADVFEPGATVMLMTMIEGRHTSRPMAVAGVEGARLSFLVDVTADWYPPVEAGSAAIHITLSDVRHNKFAAINGESRVSRDPGEVALLWSAGAAAYFDGKDDPNVAVLHVTATDGEYWDAPSGRLGSLLSMARVAITHRPEAAGDHGPITP